MSWKDKHKQHLDDRPDDSIFYKLMDGMNIFRLLPSFYWQLGPEPGEYPSVITYFKHTKVGPKGKICVCGKTADDEGNITGECYLCDVVIPKLAGSAIAQDRDRADLMQKVEFTLMQISPVKNGKFQEPKIFETQVGGDRSMGGRLMNHILRQDRFYEHPQKGRNFVIQKKVDPAVKGPKGTSYPIVDVEEMSTAIPRAIFEARKPLEDLLPAYDVEEQRAALQGRDYKRERGDSWDVGGGDSGGYDQGGYAENGTAEAGGWGETEQQADAGGWDEGGGAGDGGEGWGDGSEQAEGTEYAAEGGEGWGDGTEQPDDSAGWGAEGESGNEEWADPDGSAEDTAASADGYGWGDETQQAPPPPPPAKKGPPVKKGPPPPPTKQGPPPQKKGAPPPVKKGPPPPPPPPPPAKKGPPPPPPPPQKKGPPMKKGAPPPMKKGAPPPRR